MSLFKRKTKDPRQKRLEMEFQLVSEMCSNSDIISFETVDKREGLPPEKYKFIYNLKSIVGIEENGEPIFGDQHVVKITLPPSYPMTSSPKCYVETDIWHPNIRSKGEYKGHVCINAQVLGYWHTLDMLVQQIGEMLQYKNYHALQIQPYPEDAIVAKWVREYGEPNNIISKESKIYTDGRPLLKPTNQWLDTRNGSKKIKIIKIRKGKNENSEGKIKNINIPEKK